jgi:hypothetical protein
MYFYKEGYDTERLGSVVVDIDAILLEGIMCQLLNKSV